MADSRDEYERALPLVVMIGCWLMVGGSLLAGLMLIVAGAGAVVGGDNNWTFLGVQLAADSDALTIAVYLAVGVAMIAWALWLVANIFDVSLLDRGADRDELAPEPVRHTVVWRAGGALDAGRVAGEELLRIADAYDVAFTSEGALATVGAGGLHLWDVASAEEPVHVPDVSGHVAVSRDGRHLAMTHKDFGIVLRSLRDGKEHWTVVHRGSAWKSGFGGVSALAFSADGRRLASGGDPDSRVFSVADGSELLRIATGPTEFYGLIIDFSPDGRFRATTVTGRSVRVWDSSDGATSDVLITRIATAASRRASRSAPIPQDWPPSAQTIRFGCGRWRAATGCSSCHRRARHRRTSPHAKSPGAPTRAACLPQTATAPCVAGTSQAGMRSSACSTQIRLAPAPHPGLQSTPRSSARRAQRRPQRSAPTAHCSPPPAATQPGCGR